MKKFYTDSKVAKFILAKAYHTITIGLVVLSKKKELSMSLKNHESIHIQQRLEISLFAFVGLFLLASFGLLPWWCTILSLLSYYVLYGLEWLIRCVIIFFIGVSKFTGNKFDPIGGAAYDNLCFEKEANANEENETYIIDRPWFNWIKYIKLGRIDK